MPNIPTPASLKPAARAAGAAPAPDPLLSSAAEFGRVDPDGTVYLRAPEGEIVVGQYAAGTPEEGLAFYVRKYQDLVVEIDLTITRLRDGKANLEGAQQALTRVTEGLGGRSFVGDIDALSKKCTEAESLIAEARAANKARKEEERQAALATRSALTDEAETLAASTSWKATTERFAAIVEEWKALPRADRGQEQELWKRLSGARAAFDKARRAHFAERETVRKEAQGAKRALIAQAEALAASTDWQTTARKFRDLMGEWKKAPRGSRADEDKLWKRFKAAQDSFYAALKAHEAQEEEALAVNVPAKEALVVEAEALLPLGADISAARTTLRGIQDRWEKAGALPRADQRRLEARLKKVEDAMRTSEREHWQATNPEVKARAESTANAFTEALARMEDQLAQARANGNAAKVNELEGSIASTKALLQAAEGHL